MKLRSALTFAFALFTIAHTSAQTETFANEFGFRSDNDSYLAQGQDRYYTNGLFVYFRRATDQRNLAKNLNKKIWELEAGQKIYNPQSGRIADPADIDRPFAAYLYAGGSLNLLFNSENSLKIGLQAGTIGPNAKGKEAQELIHKLGGFYEPLGWEWQAGNEIGINATVNYKHFLKRSLTGKADFTADTYIKLGNTFTGAGAGLLFRTGRLRQLFNSASTGSWVSNNSVTKEESEHEFFFYAQPMAHYIAYDATIEGGLFSEPDGAVLKEAKPLVFSGQAGAIYSKRRWTADLSFIFRTKDVKDIVRPHQYGSAALSYRFN